MKLRIASLLMLIVILSPSVYVASEITEIIEIASEEVSEVTSEEVSEVTSEEVSEVTSEEVSEVTSEEVSEVTSEEVSEVTSEEVTSEETEVTSEEIEVTRDSVSEKSIKTSTEDNNDQVEVEKRSNSNIKVTYDSNGKVATKTYYENGKRIKYEKWSNGRVDTRIVYDSKGKVDYKVFYTSFGKRRLYENWADGAKGGYIKYTYDSNHNLEYRVRYNRNNKVNNKIWYYTNGNRSKFEQWRGTGRDNRVKEIYNYYSNGYRKYVIKYDSRNTYKTVDAKYWFDENNKRTQYENWNNGQKQRYAEYYTNGKYKITLDFTYYSNGNMKTSTRRDYTTRGEYVTIKRTYDTHYNKTDERMYGSPTSYFKIPMKNGYITCQYMCYDNHTGIDLGNTDKNVDIRATASGEVVQVTTGCSAYGGYLGNTCNYGAGNYVVVSHTYQGRKFFSIYEHLSKVNVKVGQNVTTSTKIGEMGQSGNVSGPHLHFELFEDTNKDGFRSDEYRTNPAIFTDFRKYPIKY